MEPIEQFRRLAKPPPWALTRIGGGRLRGMTDIKPAWRIEAMTTAYGLCGIGWKYEVASKWTCDGSDGQIMAFVDIFLYIKVDGEWSEPIPGNGGSMLVAKEKDGMHSSDEAYKMATTDALSTAMKMIGMGADVYAGQWDGTKYRNQPPPGPEINGEETKIIENISKGIACAKTSEEVAAIGNATKEQSPAVQDALRPMLVQCYRELKAKEKEHANPRSDETTSAG